MSPSPIVSKSHLKVAARAFTRFLKYLITELPFSILHLRITDLVAWFHWAGGQGLHTVTKLHCKDHFNYVQPTNVEDHMVDASAWLNAKRRGRMVEVVWSVHHMHSALDRVAKATAAGFKYVTHQQLTAIVGHELSKNNACWAAGTVWVRTNCIPMRGAVQRPRGGYSLSVAGVPTQKSVPPAWDTYSLA